METVESFEVVVAPDGAVLVLFAHPTAEPGTAAEATLRREVGDLELALADGLRLRLGGLLDVDEAAIATAARLGVAVLHPDGAIVAADRAALRVS